MDLPVWLRDSIQNGHELSALVMAIRLSLAFLLGLFVASVYHFSQRKPKAESVPFVATLVLLTTLIAMVTLVIGDSVTRAFSLVGALSIIRFRTVVEDTRDTAFVIFAVVVGMAVGTGHLLVAVVGIPIVTFAAVLLSLWGRVPHTPERDGTLSLRLGLGNDPDALLRDLFAEHLDQVRLLSTATAKQGAALDITYAIRFRPDGHVLAFVTALNKKDGVQNVEVRQ